MKVYGIPVLLDAAYHFLSSKVFLKLTYAIKKTHNWASLVAQTVEDLPAVQEPWVRSLGWDDPLEEGMATHSSVLAWRIPWTEEPRELQSMGSQSQT